MMTIANLFRRAARVCPLNRSLLVLAGSVFLAVAPPVLAESDSAFSLNGFGTFGLARTTTDNVEFVRDISQPRGVGKDWSALIDSVLGVQGAWHISPQFEAVVQATSRYRYDKTFTPDISWGFIKYNPTPNLSLRAGRLGTEFFMMADSRWVGYSFLTVRPPGDYFWYLPFYSIHGADAAINLSLEEGVLRAKAFYGHSNGKIPLADEQWDIAGSPMLGGYLEYQRGPWQVRASYANIEFKNDLPIAPVLKKAVGVTLSAQDAAFLATHDTRTHYYSLGLVYDRGPWQAQVMLNHIEQGSQALESSDGGYALVGYRVGEVTPYLGYSWVLSRSRGNAPSAIAAYVMQDSHADQQTTFAGLRWDFVRNVAVKAQWDGIRGEASSLFPYRQDNRARWDGRMDVFSLTMDFVF
ncbi:hypothetical protein [Ferribacterium limneticum]|uniref:hypothetical protein n=1 Tax=Ferribacterium limneticum TaxID=76259 RepID=UPI001CF82515|nr:hypothetical protein [Ferribacterium limneticum]UCV21562.1 hypothetical protein KI613_13545 [Ferribacterium limneticum]